MFLICTKNSIEVFSNTKNQGFSRAARSSDLLKKSVHSMHKYYAFLHNDNYGGFLLAAFKAQDPAIESMEVRVGGR